MRVFLLPKTHDSLLNNTGSIIKKIMVILHFVTIVVSLLCFMSWCLGANNRAFDSSTFFYKVMFFCFSFFCKIKL